MRGIASTNFTPSIFILKSRTSSFFFYKFVCLFPFLIFIFFFHLGGGGGAVKEQSVKKAGEW